MKTMYDVVVIGLGIMGAATLWRVAKKCDRALGIDACGPTHCYGSSQGNSRIFRKAYWEGEKYLQLLNQADSLWNELQQVNKTHLLFRTGGIFIGPQSSRVIAGSIKTAKSGMIEHEVWSSIETKIHSPAFNLEDGIQAVYEPGAYTISAHDARLEMLNEAVKEGANIEFGDAVANLENHKIGLRITTRSGRSYFARSVIVTAGPWIAERLLPELKCYIEPRRVPIYWFKPKINSEELFSPENFPVFLYERSDGDLLYGVPSITSNEPGVKIGFHNKQQRPAQPEWKNVKVRKEYITEITSTIEALLPKLEPSPAQAKNCYYTMSQDESFLIGKSRAFKSTYYASACSGHGFKFAPAIGEALSSMSVGQQTNFTLSAFAADRFD